MSDKTPNPPAGEEPAVPESSVPEPPVTEVTQAPEAQALPIEPSAVPPPEKKVARSWRRIFMVLGPIVVSTWVCCGVIGYRSCSSLSPGSENQTEARAVAQQYFRAVATRDWVRMYQLSDPRLQAMQSLEAMRDLILAHPELFDFDDAVTDGQNYFSNMAGGDRLRLRGHLTGRSTARRTFILDLQQQPDDSWRVRTFHVNIDLASMPSTTPSPPAPPP